MPVQDLGAEEPYTLRDRLPAEHGLGELPPCVFLRVGSEARELGFLDGVSLGVFRPIRSDDGDGGFLVSAFAPFDAIACAFELRDRGRSPDSELAVHHVETVESFYGSHSGFLTGEQDHDELTWIVDERWEGFRFLQLVGDGGNLFPRLRRGETFAES